jgi:hypothetical protein
MHTHKVETAEKQKVWMGEGEARGGEDGGGKDGGGEDRGGSINSFFSLSLSQSLLKGLSYGSDILHGLLIYKKYKGMKDIVNNNFNIYSVSC